METMICLSIKFLSFTLTVKQGGGRVKQGGVLTTDDPALSCRAVEVPVCAALIDVGMHLYANKDSAMT